MPGFRTSSNPYLAAGSSKVLMSFSVWGNGGKLVSLLLFSTPNPAGLRWVSVWASLWHCHVRSRARLLAAWEVSASLCSLQPSADVLSEVKSIGRENQGCQVRRHNLEGEERKGSLIKFCLEVSVFGFVPALICKGMRQVMAPWGPSGLSSQCQPSFSITLSLPAINFGPGSWGLVHLSLLIDTKWSVSLLMNGRSGIVTIYFTF